MLQSAAAFRGWHVRVGRQCAARPGNRVYAGESAGSSAEWVTARDSTQGGLGVAAHERRRRRRFASWGARAVPEGYLSVPTRHKSVFSAVSIHSLFVGVVDCGSVVTPAPAPTHCLPISLASRSPPSCLSPLARLLAPRSRLASLRSFARPCSTFLLHSPFLPSASPTWSPLPSPILPPLSSPLSSSYIFTL